MEYAYIGARGVFLGRQSLLAVPLVVYGYVQLYVVPQRGSPVVPFSFLLWSETSYANGADRQAVSEVC